MNKVFNFKTARGTNTASLTEVMTRWFDNADRILPAPDAPPPRPPAKPISLDYPHISTQPEYAVEAEKYNRFTAQHDAAVEKLNALRAQLSLKAEAAERSEENLISKAESLLAGEEEKSLEDEMRATAKLIEALRDAIKAQHGVVRRVTSSLTQAAGRRYAQEHKERVKRMIAAVAELHAANQAELDLHHDLIRLGYNGGSLPGMVLPTVEDHTDIHGNITHYWFKEATQYVKSPEEIAAGVRKTRLAAALS
jgi:hypothetical protein